jgi:amino acid adenylation domain-containing protein
LSGEGGAGYAVAQRELPAPAIRALAEQASASGTTLFAALLACFQTVLFGLSGERDLLIASPFAGRPRPELEGLVGCFVTTLLLRLEITPDQTFRQLCAATGEAVAVAQANQEAPLQDVLRAIPAENRGAALNVLFAVAEGAPGEFAGLHLTRLQLEDETGKFGVVCRIEETGGVWSARLVYNRAALTGERAIALLDRLSSAIVAAGQSADSPIPGPHCLSAFEQQVRERPQAVAVTAGIAKMTFASLNARAEAITRRLERQGVEAEQIVGLLLHRTPDLIAAMLGCWKAGAAFAAVDPGGPAMRVAGILRHAAVVLVERDLAPRLSEIGIPRIFLDADDEAVGTAPVAGRIPDSRSAAYVIFTSGSTGEPKGIVVEHRQIAAYTRSIVRLLGIDSQWSCGLMSSVAADLGYTVLFPTLASGGTLHLIPQEDCVDPKGFASYLRAHPLTCIKVLPSHLAALSGEPTVPPPDIVVFGGEVLDGSFVESLRQSAPHLRVFNHYGPAETTVGAVSGEVLPGRVAGRVPLGRPLDHARIVILGPDLQPVANGLSGQIAIGGGGVARGYLGAPDLTAERFIPDCSAGAEGARLYLTGDSGRWLPDGSLEFLGRLDRQVKVHGFRVEPEEIEAVLRRHPQVAASAVRPWPGRSSAPLLAAYVVLRGTARPDPESFMAYLSRQLPDYMLPGAIAILPELPRLPGGKVALQSLPHPDRVADRLDPPYADPATYTEQVIAEVWAGLFGLERVSVHSTFLSLGGYSLLAIQVIARLLEKFGVEIPFTDIYEYPTVSKLARRVEGLLIDSAGSARVTQALDDLFGAESFRVAEGE